MVDCICAFKYAENFVMSVNLDWTYPNNDEFFQAFQLLHNMYHEATACHVYNEILDLLGIIFEFLKCLRDYRSEKEVQNYLMACKDWSDIIKKLFTLLNSYSCNDMRRIVIGEYFFFFSLELDVSSKSDWFVRKV